MPASIPATSPIKIGFVLLSNERDPIPSTRIAVLNMLPFLRAAGFDPQVVFQPEAGTETPDLSGIASRLIAERFAVVFFQKVQGPSVEATVRELRAAGVRTVYGVCDRVNPAMVEATDRTVAVTEFLKSLYPLPLRARIDVVHDGIERPDACKRQWSRHRGSAGVPLKAVLVTSARLARLPVLNSPPDWLKVTIVGRYPRQGNPLRRLREAHWTLAAQLPGQRLPFVGFLLNRRIVREPWDAQRVYERMAEADIGIIPVDAGAASATEGGEPLWRVKSENRLTMKMSMGLPVVASPIPAYEAIIEQGVNGFLARSRNDWLLHLSALRDPELRREVGERARQSVQRRFSTEHQAELLVQSLHRALATPHATPTHITTGQGGVVTQAAS